jgi:hypothetical protein
MPASQLSIDGGINGTPYEVAEQYEIASLGMAIRHKKVFGNAIYVLCGVWENPT